MDGRTPIDSTLSHIAMAGVAALACVGVANDARAQLTVEIDGTALHIAGPDGSQDVEIGCAAVQAISVARRVYAACGAQGVRWVDLDRAPARVRRWPVEFAVVGLLVVDEQLWGRLADGSLRRLEVPTTDAAPVDTDRDRSPATAGAELAEGTTSPEAARAEPSGDAAASEEGFARGAGAADVRPPGHARLPGVGASFAGPRREVGDLYIDGRVPVAHGVWAIGGGGGGNTGVRYGEIGVRFLVEGNGLGGSVFLHGTVGVGMIEQGPNFSNAGPMVGLGLDARL